MSKVTTHSILHTLGVADIETATVDQAINNLVGGEADDFTRFILIASLTLNKRLNSALEGFNSASQAQSVVHMATITAAIDPLITVATAHSTALTASTAATSKVMSSLEAIKSDVVAAKATVTSTSTELTRTSKAITLKLVAANFTTITQPIAQVVIVLVLMLLTGLITRAVVSTDAEMAASAALTPSQLQAINVYARAVNCQQQRAFYVFRPDRDLGRGVCVTAL